MRKVSTEVARAEEYIITVVPVDASGSPLTVSAPTTELFIPGLTNGREYTIQVRGSNTFGFGPLSAFVQATPRTTPGGPSLNPLDVSGSRPGDGRIALIWRPPADNGGAAIEGYEVMVEEVGGSEITPTGCTSLGARARSCTLTGLTNGQAYSVRVRAVNEAGSGVMTGRSATPVSRPGAVTSLTAIVGIEQIRLTWDPPADGGGSPITEYQVTIDNAAELDGCEGPLDGTMRECTVANLTPFVNYTLEVIAVNAIGDSSAASVSERPAIRPDAPFNFRAVASLTELGRVDLSWGPPISGEDRLTRAGYRVLIDDVPAVGTCATDLLNADSSGCAITNLTAGESYTITLVATYTEGNVGSQSATAQVTIPAGVPAATPTVTLVPGDQTITVSWTEVPGAGEYIITFVNQGLSVARTIDAPSTNFVITNLVNGVEYSITVQATNNFGDGPVSDPVSATPRTTPGAPTITDTVVAGSLPGDGRITLSWTAPTETETGGAPITGYEVAVSTEDGPITPTGCTPLVAADLTCTLTGLENGTEHTIDLAARNDAGAGATATTTATPVSAPGPVQNLDAIIGIEQIRFTWQPPVDNYGDTLGGYLGQSADISPADFAPCAFISATALRECTFTGLDSATDYTVTIVPFGNNPVAGNGESNSVTARPAAQPGAPADFSAEASASVTGQIDLSWGPPANEDAGLNRAGYRVLIDGAAPTAGSCAAPPGPAATSCTITGLTGGQTYDISMLATYTEGEGVSATTATDRVDLPIGAPPTAPTVTLVTGEGTITVSWEELPAADNYIITVDPVDSSGSPITVSAPNLSFDVGGLTNGTEYTIRVLGNNNAFGPGPLSDPARATPRTTPGAPTITDTTCTLTGLTNGTTYEVSLRARNVAGLSTTAATTTATPMSIPGAVTSLTAIVGIERIGLTWDVPADVGGSPITGYRVTIDNAADLDGCEGPLGPDSRECTVTILTTLPAYTLEVFAVNAIGESLADRVTERAVPRPDAPFGFSAVASATEEGQIDLSWGSPGGEDDRLTRTGYRVMIDDAAPTAGTCATDLLNADSSECVITGLTAGQNYALTIVAIYEQGESSVGTFSVNAPAGRPATAPTVTLVPGDRMITVSWTEVPEARSYIITWDLGSGLFLNQTITAPSTSLVISNLVNGVEYPITVLATNSFGPGPSSAPMLRW